MKSKFMIMAAFAATVLFSSCATSACKQSKNFKNIDELFNTIEHFDYEKHQYIKFTDKGKMSVQHDPNCSCWEIPFD